MHAAGFLHLDASEILERIITRGIRFLPAKWIDVFYLHIVITRTDTYRFLIVLPLQRFRFTWGSTAAAILRRDTCVGSRDIAWGAVGCGVIGAGFLPATKTQRSPQSIHLTMLLSANEFGVWWRRWKRLGLLV